MLLTKASEYALLSLVELSKSDIPQDTDSLSNKLKVSKSFLAKILQSLARDGVVVSYKGAKGGFVLEKDAKDLSIRHIIELAEKRRLSVFECSTDDCCPNTSVNSCSIFPMLRNLQSKVDEFLDELTLDDLCK
jgi:Rrf2 family protein